MQRDQASSRALLIAAATVLLQEDTKTSLHVSPATAGLSERILEAYSARTRWLRQAMHRPGFRSAADWIERLTVPGILRHYALRKKCLAGLGRAALRNGATQVVVLGAGFDGCALELSREYPQARFWEVDHPATQRWKAQALSEIGPHRLHLIPADLSHGVLSLDALATTHFDSGAMNFWIAEGLLMYLPETVVHSLIGAINSLTNTAGGFAFSFMERREDGRIRFRGQSRLVDWWLGRRGEPFLWSAHSASGLATAAQAFRGLIDLAIVRGGSYYLTYHRFATREQVVACYPAFKRFLELKKKSDPTGLFQSDWYRHYQALFASA